MFLLSDALSAVWDGGVWYRTDAAAAHGDGECDGNLDQQDDEYLAPFSETDQIAKFLWGNDEVWKPMARDALHPSAYAQLETLALDYVNTLTKLDFCNSQIQVLTSLLDAVSDHRNVTAVASAIARRGVVLAEIKADLSDRRSRRNWLQHHRADLQPQLVALINEVQLAAVTNTAEIDLGTRVKHITASGTEFNVNGVGTSPNFGQSLRFRKRQPPPSLTDEDIERLLSKYNRQRSHLQE